MSDLSEDKLSWVRVTVTVRLIAAGYCSGHRRRVTRDLFSLTSFTKALICISRYYYKATKKGTVYKAKKR